jgi:cytoskeleton protein RodZ
VLEIGSSLREARIRRGFELAQIEADTHIRTRYLKALEDERFELVPGEAYVRGFLRTYADYLGLDADLFVAEYNTRFAPPEEPPPQLMQLRRPKSRTPVLRRTFGVVFAVTLVAGFVWRLASTEPTVPAPAVRPPTSTVRPTPAKIPLPAKREHASAALVLTAVRGPCWLLVHRGSRAGRQLHEGTLEEGESLRFVARRLWLRLGAPINLEARLNGKPATLPDDTANVVVTASGVRTLERS